MTGRTALLSTTLAFGTAWHERDNILVTLCRIGEGRCLTALGEWGDACPLLRDRSTDPGEHVPATLGHLAYATLEYAQAMSPRGRAQSRVRAARDRLSKRGSTSVRTGNRRTRLCRDGIAKLQVLLRKAEAGGR